MNENKSKVLGEIWQKKKDQNQSEASTSKVAG